MYESGFLCPSDIEVWDTFYGVAMNDPVHSWQKVPATQLSLHS